MVLFICNKASDWLTAPRMLRMRASNQNHINNLKIRDWVYDTNLLSTRPFMLSPICLVVLLLTHCIRRSAGWVLDKTPRFLHFARPDFDIRRYSWYILWSELSNFPFIALRCWLVISVCARPPSLPRHRQYHPQRCRNIVGVRSPVRAPLSDRPLCPD